LDNHQPNQSIQQDNQQELNRYGLQFRDSKAGKQDKNQIMHAIESSCTNALPRACEVQEHLIPFVSAHQLEEYKLRQPSLLPNEPKYKEIGK
jgi:hypothetical protein